MSVVVLEGEDSCFDGRGVFELARGWVEVGGSESPRELDGEVTSDRDSGEKHVGAHRVLLRSVGVPTGSAVRCGQPHTGAFGVTERQRELQERLEMPEALLSRTDLAALGLPRRGVDAVFRALRVVALPGYSRPMVRVAEYLELLERSSYRDDRVRP